MVDDRIDKYFLDDIDDEMLEEGEAEAAPPIIVPETVQPAATPAPPPAEPEVAVSEAVEPAPQVAEPAQQAAEQAPQAAETSAEGAEPAQEAESPPTSPAPPPAASRERRLREALEHLMQESTDIEAAALVSLDGFMIASALPEGMHEDRVGAMSAAILALGERAAAELGRGQLTQVFIEGAQGYVLIVAAGGRAVLTVLARREAKLGLVLYDMRAAADIIAEILP